MVVARGGVGVGVVDAVVCVLWCVCVRVRDSTRDAQPGRVRLLGQFECCQLVGCCRFSRPFFSHRVIVTQ